MRIDSIGPMFEPPPPAQRRKSQAASGPSGAVALWEDGDPWEDGARAPHQVDETHDTDVDAIGDMADDSGSDSVLEDPADPVECSDLEGSGVDADGEEEPSQEPQPGNPAREPSQGIRSTGDSDVDAMAEFLFGDVPEEPPLPPPAVPAGPPPAEAAAVPAEEAEEEEAEEAAPDAKRRRAAPASQSARGSNWVDIMGFEGARLKTKGTYSGLSILCPTCGDHKDLHFVAGGMQESEAMTRLARWVSACPGAAHHRSFGGRLLKDCASDRPLPSPS